jgi:hypothetical protein
MTLNFGSQTGGSNKPNYIETLYTSEPSLFIKNLLNKSNNAPLAVLFNDVIITLLPDFANLMIWNKLLAIYSEFEISLVKGLP